MPDTEENAALLGKAAADLVAIWLGERGAFYKTWTKMLYVCIGNNVLPVLLHYRTSELPLLVPPYLKYQYSVSIQIFFFFLPASFRLFPT